MRAGSSLHVVGHSLSGSLGRRGARTLSDRGADPRTVAFHGQGGLGEEPLRGGMQGSSSRCAESVLSAGKHIERCSNPACRNNELFP